MSDSIRPSGRRIEGALAAIVATALVAATVAGPVAAAGAVADAQAAATDHALPARDGSGTVFAGGGNDTGLSPPSTGASLAPATVDLAAGESTRIGVFVENATGGVGAFAATVTSDASSTVEITDVTVAGDPDRNLTATTVADDGASASATAAGLDTPDAGRVRIATVTVTGRERGTARLSLAVRTVGNETGYPYAVPLAANASVTVGRAPGLACRSEYADTGAVNVSFAESGLAYVDSVEDGGPGAPVVGAPVTVRQAPTFLPRSGDAAYTRRGLVSTRLFDSDAAPPGIDWTVDGTPACTYRVVRRVTTSAGSPLRYVTETQAIAGGQVTVVNVTVRNAGVTTTTLADGPPADDIPLAVAGLDAPSGAYRFAVGDRGDRAFGTTPAGTAFPFDDTDAGPGVATAYTAGRAITVAVLGGTTAPSAAVARGSGDANGSDRLAVGVDPATLAPDERASWTIAVAVHDGGPARGRQLVSAAGYDFDVSVPPRLVVSTNATGDEYASIGAALDAAPAGAVIEVRPGTYRESLVVDRNVTLVAPAGATLNGSDLPDDEVTEAITIREDAAPAIEGFRIEGFEVGVDALGTDGDWTLRNATVRDALSGIKAAGTAGDWALRNVTVRPDSLGVNAAGTTGNWTIRGSTVVAASGGRFGAGDGIVADRSSGDWSIRGTTIRDNARDGIEARNTTGAWAVHESTLAGNGEQGIDARDATPAGDATRNWWGNATGPSGTFAGSGEEAVGNLTVAPFYADAARTELNRSDIGDGDGGNESGGRTIVVDAGGGGDNSSIGAAVSNASDGDTIRVRPGTYRFNATAALDENVTLVAPEGATINASGVDRTDPLGQTAAVAVRGDAAATIRGFTITGTDVGVLASDTSGAWTVRNVTLNGVQYGIRADRSNGSWTVRNVVADDLTRRGLGAGNSAVFAEESRGAWTIRNLTLRNANDDDVGMDASGSSGDWTVSGLDVRNASGMVVDRSSGDWTVRNATIRTNRSYVEGIEADHSTGAWTVANVTVTVEDRTSIAVSASETEGDWTIRSSSILIDDGFSGVAAGNSTGGWTIEGSTIEGGYKGIGASGSSGAWTVRNSVIRDATTGLDASASSGDWTVRTSTVVRNGAGIGATDTNGSWAIHRTSFRFNGNGIDAEGADPAGDATRNWWADARGPDANDCVGAVDCGDYLTSPRDVDVDRGEGTTTLVVDGEDDGDDEFRTIQRAINTALDGDRIEIRPGTYRDSTGRVEVRPGGYPEGLMLDRNVTLAAPDGAVLHGHRGGDGLSRGVEITRGAEPAIAGLTITGYHTGIAAFNSTTDWTVRNVTLVDLFSGIEATESAGRWELRNVTIAAASLGVDARDTGGGWRIRGTTIRDGGTGVNARDSTGPWTIQTTTVRNASDAAVLADFTSGAWEIHRSSFVDNTEEIYASGVAAREAFPAGDATRNWWGDPSGPDANDCYGNVRCENHLTSPPVAIDDGTNDPGAALVVDGAADGDDAYPTVAAAIDDASDGDRIEVRPGTYPATVTVDRNVTIVAPSGATLDGSGLDTYEPAITIQDGAASTIAGLTITGYDAALGARESTGAWTLRNATIVDVERSVVASRSSGDWTLRNVTIRSVGAGIDAGWSAGDWTVAGSTVRNTTFDELGHGVRARGSTGDWTVRGTVIADTDAFGVTARSSTGSWTIRRSVVRDAGDRHGGVNARNTTGAWTIRRSAIVDNTAGLLVVASGIDATGADPAGDATRNWWGDPSGPDANDCAGNVTCGNHLAAPPDGLPSADDGEPTTGPPPVAGNRVPSDPDDDGVYEDVNGDGDVTPGDATVLFNAVFEGDTAVTGNTGAFDLNGDGSVTPGDATVLFGEAF